MENILIIGSTGKIGSYILQALTSSYLVHTVSRLKADKYNFHYDFENQSGDLNSLKEIKFKALIFCVGILPSSRRSKEAYQKINAESVSILAQHVNHNCKFIFMSTISVYGESIVGRDIIETNKIAPKNLYAKSKLDGEASARKLFDKCFVFRIPPVYLDFEDKTIYKRVVKNRFFEIRFGDDRQAHSFCSLSTLSVITKDFIDHNYKDGIFHVADSQVLSSRDLKKKLKFKALLVVRVNKTCFEGLLAILKLSKIKVFSDKLNEIYFKLFCNNIYSTEKVFTQMKKEIR